MPASGVEEPHVSFMLTSAVVGLNPPNGNPDAAAMAGQGRPYWSHRMCARRISARRLVSGDECPHAPHFQSACFRCHRNALSMIGSSVV